MAASYSPGGRSPRPGAATAAGAGAAMRRRRLVVLAVGRRPGEAEEVVQEIVHVLDGGVRHLRDVLLDLLGGEVHCRSSLGFGGRSSDRRPDGSLEPAGGLVTRQRTPVDACRRNGGRALKDAPQRPDTTGVSPLPCVCVSEGPLKMRAL